jgi:rod shape-determining protein MreD
MRAASPTVSATRLVAILLVAFVVHAAYDGRLAIGAAHPSISLTVLLTSALFVNAETGAWLGFMAGLLEASYTPRFVGSYIVTRTLAGFLVGLLEERIFRDSIFVAVTTVFVGTLFVDTCFFAFAPQRNAALWFKLSLYEAFYNAILSVFVYGFFKKWVLKPAN